MAGPGKTGAGFLGERIGAGTPLRIVRSKPARMRVCVLKARSHRTQPDQHLSLCPNESRVPIGFLDPCAPEPDAPSLGVEVHGIRGDGLGFLLRVSVDPPASVGAGARDAADCGGPLGGVCAVVHLVYFSLWPYVIILPAFYAGFRQLLVYLTGALLISGVGMSIFYFSPTAVPAERVANRAQHPGFDLLEGVDATGNACPSLHVAFAVYTALGMRRVLREIGAPAGAQHFNLLWGGAIALSTLTTGQHVFLDLIAGGALAALTAVPVFDLLHRRTPEGENQAAPCPGKPPRAQGG